MHGVGLADDRQSHPGADCPRAPTWHGGNADVSEGLGIPSADGGWRCATSPGCACRAPAHRGFCSADLGRLCQPGRRPRLGMGGRRTAGGGEPAHTSLARTSSAPNGAASCKGPARVRCRSPWSPARPLSPLPITLLRTPPCPAWPLPFARPSQGGGASPPGAPDGRRLSTSATQARRPTLPSVPSRAVGSEPLDLACATFSSSGPPHQAGPGSAAEAGC